MPPRDKAFKTSASARAKSINQWPLLLIIFGELIALVLIWIGHWRWGCVVFGGSLCAGALERVVLSRRMAGLLQVRTRLFDIITLTGMGLAIIVLALAVPRLD